MSLPFLNIAGPAGMTLGSADYPGDSTNYIILGDLARPALSSGSLITYDRGTGVTAISTPSGPLVIAPQDASPGPGAILTDSTGNGVVSWQMPVTPQTVVSYVHCYINGVPAGADWQAWVGPLPYARPSAGYPGDYVRSGSDIYFDPPSGRFTVNAPGTYRVTVMQNINTVNALGPILSDGRLRLEDELGNQIAQDTGRYEVTPALAALELSFNATFDVVSYLDPGWYAVVATAENGGPGLLISKGSCHFERLVMSSPPPLAARQNARRRSASLSRTRARSGSPARDQAEI